MIYFGTEFSSKEKYGLEVFWENKYIVAGLFSPTLFFVWKWGSKRYYMAINGVKRLIKNKLYKFKGISFGTNNEKIKHYRILMNKETKKIG